MNEVWEQRWSQLRFEPPWEVSDKIPILHERVRTKWIPEGARVLDLGCGRGDAAAWLCTQGMEVTGVDFSPSAIQLARTRHENLENLTFLQMDACSPNNRLGSFDIVFDRGCLHTINDDLQRIYAENLLRWSKQGTRYLLLMHLKGQNDLCRRERQVRDLFEPAFRLESFQPCDMHPEGSAKSIPGVAFFLERQ